MNTLLTKLFAVKVSSALLTTIGIALLILAIISPIYLNNLKEHGQENVSAYFTPGTESLRYAISSLLASFSIFVSIVVVLISFFFDKKTKPITIFFGVVALLSFLIGIIISSYLSLLRPLTGTSPSILWIYCSLTLLFIGLSFTMFTLATKLNSLK